jgi:hypothetical protein
VLLDDLFSANGGVATTAQLRTVLSRKALRQYLEAGALIRVWHGVYAQHPPDLVGRLAALDLMAGTPIVACMDTAATLHGFSVENDDRIHILDPGVRMRPNRNLLVHQRIGAPLSRVSGRLVTAPAWTVIEVGRSLWRPRALATLDAALRSATCTSSELDAAVREQKGRRGIVKMRDLLPLADGRSESAMESEARLVFIDACLPRPELQYEIVDRTGQLWRVDFAWPDELVAVEYDSMEWHANPNSWKRDRIKAARLADCGWTLVPVVVDDVRTRSADLVAGLRTLLQPVRLVG